MKCVFCAEEIQDAAVLCRFCGARKIGDTWQPPAAASPPKKVASGTNFTMKSSAVLFFLAAAYELFSVTDPVAIFGDNRGGAVAVIIHVIYVGLFAGLGFGLWKQTTWGYPLVFAATGFYVLHKLLYVFDAKARHAELQAAMSSDLIGMVGGGAQLQLDGINSMVNAAVTIETWIAILCWLSFAVYVRARRAYFQPHAS